MCVINIGLNTTTPDGTTITSANGRYRIVGGSRTWTNFVINLLAPKTPNITTLGIYNLQVNVTNNAGVTSDWASSTFEVSNNCLGTTATVDLGSAICREEGLCRKSAPCSVRYSVLVTGTNAGDYITVLNRDGTATVSVHQANAFNETPEITYSEQVSGSKKFNIELRNANGNIITQSEEYITHQTTWSTLKECLNTRG